ncbi:MAG: type II toxin-antitoxin system RelE/ParE family toxin [Oscillatoriales cyanobacterium RU_3_3]|nr:type II toxin-antitoxin system RelE/ParE family toxin [Oscillatoriales cyanobacterium RU_3_3]NJR21331.1 type II toxin-antitoxin system RelE/ParE family toxin [Richelia sp. CSU_2_1]
MSETPNIEVLFADRFKRQLRTLAKRYRQIQSDLQPLLQQLQAGECPGDRISGTGYTVFKERVKNSDIGKGKSGGYRIIYQVTSSTCFILLIIYAKSEQETVAVEEIQEVIDSFRERKQ